MSISLKNLSWKNLLIFLTAVSLWIFSFPVAWNGQNISSSAVNSLCVFLYLLPLLYLLKNTSPGKAFQITYLASFIAYYFILNWIQISMRDYSDMHPLLAQTLLILTVCLIAFYPALGMFIYKKYTAKQSSPWLHIFVGSLAFISIECLREWTPFGGFPWVMPGYGLSGLRHIVQSVDLFGVLGLSSALYLVQFAVFVAWQYKQKRYLGFALLLFAGFYLYGQKQLNYFAQNADRYLSMAWVQGNIPQNIKWSTEGRDQAMAIYTEATKKHIEQGAQVVVWPEAAVTYLYYQQSNKNVFDAHYLNDAYLVFGAPSYSTHAQKKFYQNSAFAVGQDNILISRTDKFHLVPFGEYLPWPLHLVQRIIPAIAGNFISNPKQNLIELPQVKFGVLICYESLFGRLAKDKVHLGANILLNLTNDAWFNNSSGPYQHKVFSQFRSIETRRSLVRAANTGISTWFDGTGKQHQSLGLYQRGSLQDNIPIYTDMTFYVRYPYLMIFVILAGWIIFFLIQTPYFKKEGRR